MPLIPMVSPSFQPIIGAKLQDGSVTPFKCHFDRKLGEPIFIYVYPDGVSEKLLMINGEQIFVDASDQEWLSSDVEFESTPPL